MNERSIDALHPRVAQMCRRHIQNCLENGINIIITSTFRSFEEQDRLYAIGRTKPGRKVTNAKGGQSMHNYRLAYDVVPMRHGKPVWGTTGNGIDKDPSDDMRDDLELWQRVGELGKAAGLEWAGDWKRFREFPHFQWTDGLTLKDLQAGKRPL